MKPTVKRNLQRKIFESYDCIEDFLEESGLKRYQLNSVLKGSSDGTIKFWECVQKALKIPDIEMIKYMKEGEQT